MKTAVLRYLMEHFGVTESKGMELMAKYFMEIADAQKWASQPYYPAQRIAASEKIEHLQNCPGCEAEALADLPQED